MLRCLRSIILLAVFLALSTAAHATITVSGKKILRNGAPFEIHGVQFMSFVAPIGYLRNPPPESCPRSQTPPCPFRAYIRARREFGMGLLEDAKRFGANTILFKVSEPGLNPNDPYYSSEYLSELTKGVREARSLGFAVILSIQETRVSGTPGPRGTRSPIPDEGTLVAAETLAKTFGGDRDIMIELYVEPYARGPAAEFWNYYINGGGGFVGVNQIIRAVRSTGSQNVLFVEPLGQNFSRYPGGIVDPSRQLAYAIHAYFNMVGTTRAEWDLHYGNFATTHAVVVTEWSEKTGTWGRAEARRGLWCYRAAMNTPLQAFHYFGEKGIVGVVGWSFDLPRTIVTDFRGTPSTLANFRCGETGGGIGSLLVEYFRHSLPPLTASMR